MVRRPDCPLQPDLTFSLAYAPSGRREHVFALVPFHMQTRTVPAFCVSANGAVGICVYSGMRREGILWWGVEVC